MKVTIKPIVIDALGTITAGFIMGLEDREITGPSKLLHYWNQSEYWEESWRLEETGCLSNSSESPSAKVDVKNYQGVDNNNMFKLSKKL